MEPDIDAALDAPPPAETRSDAEIIGVKRRGRPPGSKNKPKEQTVSPDAALQTLKAALHGFMLLAGFALWLFGVKQKEEYTDSEVEADAKQLLPIAMRYMAVVTALSWIGAPIVIVNRIRQKFDFANREKKAAKGKHLKDVSAPSDNPVASPLPVTADPKYPL